MRVLLLVVAVVLFVLVAFEVVIGPFGGLRLAALASALFAAAFLPWERIA